MLNLRTLLFVFTILYPCLGCKPSPKAADVQVCDSFEDLNTAGSQPEWKKLVLMNPGDVKRKLLSNGAFKNVPNLQNLWIENLVNKIEPAVFKQLPNLKMLHLVHNEIPELPKGIFDGLHLKVLEITNSGLTKVEPGTFNNIETVILDSNNLQPEDIFRNNNIQMLTLSNNSISKLEDCAFCGMKNLRILNLHYNSLTSFDPVRVLGEKSSLEGLGLDQNKLTTIPKFPGFVKFTGISVSNNSIDKIEEGAFVDSPKMSLLELSHNKLTDIPANIIPELKEDQVFLVINNNKIQCLNKEVRDKINILRRLTVEDNPWQCECLNEVIEWAKSKKAYVGCDKFVDVCSVECVDKNNKKQIVDVKYQ